MQAITLPALSKAWKEWAEDQGAKKRALEQVKSEEYKIWTGSSYVDIFHVPLWVAQRRSHEQKRRFQLRAAAHGDVGAVDWVGVGDDHEGH